MSLVLDRSGTFHVNGKSKPEDRPDLQKAPSARPPARIGHYRPVEASYDVGRASAEFDNYWANADRLDADSADSKTVRGIITARSRYEVGSNGYYDGMVQTHTDFVVGDIGPTLRLMEKDEDFNREAEEAWWAWAKAIQYRRKLWVGIHARVQDGEGFAVMRVNPKIENPIKLDIVPFECEQCTSPNLPPNTSKRIDGIWLDDYGNPEFYDILRYHPGAGRLLFRAVDDVERIPAQWVLHCLTIRRPGQHRAVPEFKSTLNVGASSRRWREATVTAAETAADFAVVIHTNMPPEAGYPDHAAPFSTSPIEKRMYAAMPEGWDPEQLEGKHPNAQYREFLVSQISETGRPKSMPKNIAVCDSSDYNFASGKLDQEPYFKRVNVERADADDDWNDKHFKVWWPLAVLTYGWAWDDPYRLPAHRWDWPKHPVGDVNAVSEANDRDVKNGVKSMTKIYAERGEDYEDELILMAKDYGVTVDVMREHLLATNLSGAKAALDRQAAADQAKLAADNAVTIASTKQVPTQTTQVNPTPNNGGASQ